MSLQRGAPNFTASPTLPLTVAASRRLPLPAACRVAEREGVRTVLCLQEDSDMAYFSLDLAPILQRCAARGDVDHVRHRIR